MKRKHLKITVSLLSAVLLISTANIGLTGPFMAEEVSEQTVETEETSSEVLKVGSNSDDVRILQEQLQKLGFLSGPADGDFGSVTQSAVEMFQEAYGMDVTGEVSAEDAAFLIVSMKSTEPKPVQEQPEEETDAPEEDSQKEESGRTLTIGTADILIDPDGTCHTDINTVSEKTLAETRDIFTAVREAYRNSDKIPEQDLIPCDEDGNMIVPGQEEDPEAEITVQWTDYDTGEPVGEAETVTLKALYPEIPEDAEVFFFRNVPIIKGQDGYSVNANTVSKASMSECFNLFTSVWFAYNHSTEIPEDIETMIEVNPEDLPEGITKDMLVQDEETGAYYIGSNVLTQRASESGQEVVVTDTAGNRVTVGQTGTISSDTGSVQVRQPAQAQNGSAAPAASVSQSVSSVNHPTVSAPTPAVQNTPTQPAGNTNTSSSSGSNSVEQKLQNELNSMLDDHAINSAINSMVGQNTSQSSGTNQNVGGNTNQNTSGNIGTGSGGAGTQTTAPTPAPAPSPTSTPAPTPTQEPTPQPETAHVHNWQPVYNTIHHDAVTHQEPSYKTVHHDAVTHEEPVYEDVWVSETWEQGAFLGYKSVSYSVIVCNTCQAVFDNGAAFEAHAMGAGGGTCPGGYHTETRSYEDTNQPVYDSVYVPGYWDKVQTGTTTVTDQAAYDEQVQDGFITVVDREAYDETVVSYSCSCGATK